MAQRCQSALDERPREIVGELQFVEEQLASLQERTDQKTVEVVSRFKAHQIATEFEEGRLAGAFLPSSPARDGQEEPASTHKLIGTVCNAQS